VNSAGDKAEAKECCIKKLLFDPHAHAINESDNTPRGRNTSGVPSCTLP
jgi:hypothetical protein